MSILDEPCSRRRFIGIVTTVIGGIVVQPAISLADTLTTATQTTQLNLESRTISSIPEFNIITGNWEAEDITDLVREKLTEKHFAFAVNPNYYGMWDFSSPYDRFFMGSSILTGSQLDDKIPINVLLGNQYLGSFLFDSKNKKIYYLDLDIEKSIIGSSALKILKSVVADNGTCLYGFSLEDGNLLGVTFANLNARKKVIIRPGDLRLGEFNSFKLSDAGTNGVIPKDDGFYIFDTNSLQILYEGNGRLEAMDYNASVIAFYDKTRGFYRRDMNSKEETMICVWPAFRAEFSPDGNFCAFSTAFEEHDKNGKVTKKGKLIHIYNHTTGELFRITGNCPDNQDFVQKRGVSNNGTVNAISGTYVYFKGRYQFASPEIPFGLKIEKIR